MPLTSQHDEGGLSSDSGAIGSHKLQLWLESAETLAGLLRDVHNETRTRRSGDVECPPSVSLLTET